VETRIGARFDDTEVADPSVVSAEVLRATVRSMADLLASLTEQIQSAVALLRDLSAQVDAYRPEPARPERTHAALTVVDPAPELRLLCLGPFEAYWGEEPVCQLRTGKGRAILKYLAARPRQPVLRDVLLEALWPETAPGVANNRLKVALHHLRQVCAAAAGPERGECVVFRDGGYVLNPRVRVWTDLEAFEAAWRAGARLERAGQPARAVPFFAEAVALYRGDYLEEDPFEEWTLLRREELKDLYLTMLGKLSAHWLQAGELERATEGWTRILDKDPCREDAYRQLMLCCARRGQRALALRWYELCARFLRDQLRVDPEPATVALYRALRAGDDAYADQPAG
jgi:DNA-binding SARP family transcriptional activator